MLAAIILTVKPLAPATIGNNYWRDIPLEGQGNLGFLAGSELVWAQTGDAEEI